MMVFDFCRIDCNRSPIFKDFAQSDFFIDSDTLLTDNFNGAHYQAYRIWLAFMAKPGVNRNPP
jgi:hypothetical protein